MFRYRPEQPVAYVDVRGEMVHWQHPAELARAADAPGWLEASLEVPVGAYAYKFRVGHDGWALDPANPRTRAVDGERNSLLVVGGADEPVLHAPARPFVYVEDDGRVCVRAGLRAAPGDAAGLRLSWSDGGPRTTTPMRRVGREDEHTLFEAMLPGSGRALEYVFVLDDGRLAGAPGGPGQTFRVARRAVTPAAPEWWRDAVLYTIFVDRFRRGAGDWDGGVGFDRDHRCGGDLAGVAAALPYLVDLGVTALHLTPICPARSVHRYDSVDPRAVAAELGGEAAFAELLARARDAGLRVLVDLAVTHVHRDHPAFCDVRERGPRSPRWEWFRAHAWPFFEGPDPGYEHYQKGQWQEPLLDLDNPEVADYVVGTFEHWARLGADGFRVDAAAEVPPELIRRITRAVRAIRRDAVVFGEVIPGHLHRWTAAGLDAATDFAFHEGLCDWLARGTRDAASMAALCERRRFDRGGPGWSSLAFVGTHDQPRFRSRVADPRRARLAQLFALVRAAVPALYYGDEVGLRSDEPARAFEDSWPDRQPMPWSELAWDRDTRELVRAAIALRRQCRALRRGDESYVYAAGSVLIVRRQWADEIVDVALNGGEAPVRVPLPPGEVADELLALGDAAVADGAIELGPWSAVALGRTPVVGDVELEAHTAAIAGAAYARGMNVCPTPPSKLYVTVTEACNLRCQHCITDAPELTRSGRARELRPWVVDRLREAFAAADYIAFSHGGESLVAPMFFDVLRAIRRARAGRPCDVHLLTNGMLLDRATSQQLVELGVTSVMVSIDGATAATNDRIRAGAELDRVLRHVRELLALRADVRVGISTVVGASNADELAQLARMAVDLGVHWLKLEETYPATAFARRDLLAPRERRMTAALAAVRAELAGSPVVLVDHVAPPGGCRCSGDPAVTAFRDADDFANRTAFHPCRAAWDQLCVDPDGTLHAVDYFTPALGNLADAPLMALWNGPVARNLRDRALASVSPEQRAKCA